MKIGYELTIEQSQKLAMTPELIQAIQILQYSNQELKEYIDNELIVIQMQNKNLRLKLQDILNN